MQGASGKPPASSGVSQLCCKKSLPRGLTRRLRRGLGLAVPWGAHTFLSVAKEKCAKESQRHGDSGKKPFIAHFDGGARYVARSGVGQLTHAIVRARSSPFSAAKMGGPFSLRCLSPLCSPAVGGGHTYPVRVGMPSVRIESFWNAKGQRGFEAMLAFIASHEACRRMAVKPRPSCMSPELTRALWRGVGCRGTTPARPANRGTCRATAVKPRQSRMSRENPARLCRAEAGQGLQPLRMRLQRRPGTKMSFTICLSPTRRCTSG